MCRNVRSFFYIAAHLLFVFIDPTKVGKSPESLVPFPDFPYLRKHISKKRFAMNTFIETERLILREIPPSDREAMFRLDSDPEVHRYLGGEPLTDIGQADEVIRFIRRQYADNGIGRWAVLHKHTGTFIGWAGLKWVTEPMNGHTHYYDLGYRLMHKHWGKGYATEAARAWVDYAFRIIGTDAVYALTECGNTASDNVLLKAGFRLADRFELEGVAHNWYEIKKGECNARQCTSIQVIIS